MAVKKHSSIQASARDSENAAFFMELFRCLDFFPYFCKNFVNMKRILIITTLTFGMYTATAQQLPYQNPSLSPEERAEDLCSRLTLKEKALLMMDRSPAIPRLGVSGRYRGAE